MESIPSFTSVIWHLGGVICHQLPDRSPHFESEVFPLCYRCAGLHLTMLVSFAFLATTGGFRRRLPASRHAVAISLLTVPLLIDGWANLLGLWSSPGWFRAFTGMGVGLVLPLLLVPLAHRTPAEMIDVAKPTLSTPFGLLAPAGVGLALLGLMAHPMRLSIFQGLGVAALCSPAVFLCTFILAGWQNRAVFAQVQGVGCRPAAQLQRAPR